MKSLILALALSTIAGCATSGVTKNIQWKRVSLEDVQKICNSYRTTNTEPLYGCTMYDAKLASDNTCIVYTSASIEKFSPLEQLLLGHEMMHCFEGDWHK